MKEVPRKGNSQGGQQQASRRRQGLAPVGKGPVQQLEVGPLHRRDGLGLVIAVAALEQVGRQHRRQGQRQDQGHEQGDGDGVGQGREHLALHAFQGHQRQEHQDDDADAEDHRRGHFLHRVEDDPHPLSP
jgi:hypothetical protein